MSTDFPDSGSKHHRSPPDDESKEHSKSLKHRHHHRSHRRHGHHKSSRTTTGRGEKRVEEAIVEIETMNGDMIAAVVVQEAEEIVSPAVSGKIRVDDDDVEEGEILDDDDAFCVGNDEIETKAMASAGEAGEIEARTEGDNLYTKDAIASENGDKMNSNSVGNDVNEGDLATVLAFDESEKKTQSLMDTDDFLFMEKSSKEDTGGSGNAKSRSRIRSGSPQRRSEKLKHHYVEKSQKEMEVEEGEIGLDVNPSSYGSIKVKERELGCSPTHSMHSNELQTKFAEGVSKKMRHVSCSGSGHHNGDGMFSVNGKIDYVSDYKRVAHAQKTVNDKERGSYSYSRSTDHEGIHFGCKSEERGREERIEQCDRRDWDEEHKKTHMDHERENNHHKEREKERDKGRDRGRECNRELERDREKVGKRSRGVVEYTDSDRDKERKKNDGGSMEREREREWRDSSKASYRDRYAETGTEMVSYWERKRERERESYREKKRQRDIEKERERDKILEQVVDERKDRRESKYRDVKTERSSRYRKYDDCDDGLDDRGRTRYSKHHTHGPAEYRKGRGREEDSKVGNNSKDDSAMSGGDRENRIEDDQEDYLDIVELKFAEQEEEDLNRVKEESRKRSEAILQKYKNQQIIQMRHDLECTGKEKEPLHQPIESPQLKEVPMQNSDANSNTKDADVGETSFSVEKSPPENDASAIKKESDAGGLGEGTPKSERSTDMFCDEIFGDSPAGVRKSGKTECLRVERSSIHDNWDDPEGYYCYRFGEVLDGRYEITAAHGKGVFSTVVRAKDLRSGTGDPEEVAVKIIRNNETMLKAGQEEFVILKKLVSADPDDRRHCVRFLSSFKYRNHLCLVFESLHMNLREVLKKFGRNIGLKLTAVRAYAKQLFIALKHLRNCGVLHCDIKPDNMLVNDAKNVLKLCDFGNAMFAGKNEITPYLVSRFYRAPEIILGLPYDHPMDIWSVGCCLYELYTGKVLFPGPTNNDMLRLHMELKGSFPKKMLRKGAFIDQHFDQDLNFLATEEDPVTKKAVKRLMANMKPKDITAIIKVFPGEDPKMFANFKDLLDKIFMLDPDKRLTVSQALNHPFITGIFPVLWVNTSVIK